MIISVIGLCGFKIAWISVAMSLFPKSQVALYMSFPLAWILTSLVSFVFFIITFRRLSKRANEEKLLERLTD